MNLADACHAADISFLGKWMLGPHATLLFPTIETLHVIGMAVLVGSIGAFDLRLLGLIMRRERVSRMAERLLPTTWTAFAVMITTGVLMFVTAAEDKYCFNSAFRIKLALMALAGVNMAIFHFTTYRSVTKWDQAAVTPIWAKLVGSFSVLLWGGVVIAGRWVGFVAKQ